MSTIILCAQISHFQEFGLKYMYQRLQHNTDIDNFNILYNCRVIGILKVFANIHFAKKICNFEDFWLKSGCHKHQPDTDIAIFNSLNNTFGPFFFLKLKFSQPQNNLFFYKLSLKNLFSHTNDAYSYNFYILNNSFISSLKLNLFAPIQFTEMIFCGPGTEYLYIRKSVSLF